MITPLPFGEGKGEGPPLLCVLSLFAERLLFICENLWEIKYPTSLLRSKLCERKNSKSFTVLMKKPDKSARETPYVNRVIWLKTEVATNKKSITYRLEARRALVSIKKGLHNTQEGHVLQARRASAWSKKGVHWQRGDENYLHTWAVVTLRMGFGTAVTLVRL